MPEIGIVIVTYNSAAEIGPCLDAAMRTGAEIVVIDNGSCDATALEVARHPVRFIANVENRGFAAAVNQGFAALDVPYIVLLNPDAVIAGGLEPLREACRLPAAAGASGQLLDAAGKPQAGFMVRRLPRPLTLALEVLLLNRIWPGNPVNRRFRGADWDIGTRFAAEQPAGAFLMVRRAVWRELGGFDEGFYPLWFEDVDFCRRVADRGYTFYFVPAAVANHTGGHSIARLPLEMRRFYWYRSLLRYSARHFRPVAFRGVCAAVLLGSFLRLIAEPVWLLSLKPLAAYGRVMRLAGRCLFTGWRDGEMVSGPQFHG